MTTRTVLVQFITRLSATLTIAKEAVTITKQEFQVIGNTKPERTGRTRKAVSTKLETDFVVQPCQPDPKSIRLAIREWLVPLLVREFLAEQDAGKGGNKANQGKRTIEPMARGRGEPHRDHANE